MPHKAARYHRFQSTLPLRGATNATTDAMIAILKFQSTLPLRGATIFFLLF